MVSEVHDLIRKVYEQPHGAVGGNLHIVLDDYNVEDDWIIECYMKPLYDEFALTPVERDCAVALLKVPEDNRVDVIREAMGRG